MPGEAIFQEFTLLDPSRGREGRFVVLFYFFFLGVSNHMLLAEMDPRTCCRGSGFPIPAANISTGRHFAQADILISIDELLIHFSCGKGSSACISATPSVLLMTPGIQYKPDVKYFLS